MSASCDLPPNFKLYKQGAEARLYKGTYLGKPTIVKERFQKTYRHPNLDGAISRERMKAEARALLKSRSAGVFAPAVYLVDLKRRCIFMEEILNSTTVKSYLDTILSQENIEATQKQKDLATKIGTSVASLHKEGIIHGDLTTSNILVTLNENRVDKLYFIDFGLSHSALMTEDQGVDLYVLERAILSTHPHATSLFLDIIDAYVQCSGKDQGSQIIIKLKEVRARGRKRSMVG